MSCYKYSSWYYLCKDLKKGGKILIDIFIVMITIMFFVYVIKYSVKAHSSLMGQISMGDWIGYCGNLIGSFVGGMATFFCLFITIKFEGRKDEENTRKQMMPYIKVTCEEYDEETGKNDFDEGKATIFSFREKYKKIKNIGQIAENISDVIEYKEEENKEESKEENKETKKVRCYLYLENVGLGAAAELNLLRAIADGKRINIVMGEEIPILKINEQRKVYFEITQITDDIIEKFCINCIAIYIILCYNDLLGNYYEQSITLSINYEDIEKKDKIYFEILNFKHPIIDKGTNMEDEKKMVQYDIRHLNKKLYYMISKPNNKTNNGNKDNKS